MSVLEGLGLSGVSVTASRSGSPTLVQGDVRLLSGHDPRKEAGRQAASVGAERVALVGLGLGYLACALGPRLATLIRAEGEDERCRIAHGGAPPLYAASFDDRVVRDEVELLRDAWDASVRGETLVIDPSWNANPALVARLREVEAGARWGGMTAGRSRQVPEDAVRAVEAALPVELVAKVLASQGRHHLHDDPPFAFEVAPPWPPGFSPERVLCVQPSSIGDVLYFTPALAALRARFPGASIGMVVDEDAVSGIQGGDADCLFIARRAAWCSGDAVAAAGVRRFLGLLAAWKPDLVFNPHATARAAWYATVAAGAGPGERPAMMIGLGFGRDGVPVLRGTLHHARWLTEMGSALTLGAIPAPLLPPPGVHAPWGAAADLARRCGVSISSARPRIVPGDRDLRAAAVFRACSGRSEHPFIAVHTGSRAAERRYRRSAWPDVVAGLLALDHDVVLIGGAPDVERNEWIRERIDPAIAARVTDATARGDLRFTAALLSTAALLVGPETSTVHLAAAVNCPALTITGRVLSGWSGSSAARSLVVHGPADPPWCGALDPSTVVAAAAFVLGRGPWPELPPGFEASWTGDREAGEFGRETRPWASLSEAMARERILGLAWAVFVGEVNAALGWPEHIPRGAEVRAVCGAVPPSLASEVRGLLALPPEDPWWRRFSAVPFGAFTAIAAAQAAARRFLEDVIREA